MIWRTLLAIYLTGAIGYLLWSVNMSRRWSREVPMMADLQERLSPAIWTAVQIFGVVFNAVLWPLLLGSQILSRLSPRRSHDVLMNINPRLVTGGPTENCIRCGRPTMVVTVSFPMHAVADAFPDMCRPRSGDLIDFPIVFPAQCNGCGPHVFGPTVQGLKAWDLTMDERRAVLAYYYMRLTSLHDPSVVIQPKEALDLTNIWAEL